MQEEEQRLIEGVFEFSDAEVREALEDWGTALGNVTAHEIGHAGPIATAASPGMSQPRSCSTFSEK